MHDKERNILVTTFGTSWAILPELIGFLSPEAFDFYANHPARNRFADSVSGLGSEGLDEIWVIHTDSDRARLALETFREWQTVAGVRQPKVRYFCYKGVSELGSEEECRAMLDLIFRTILKASAQAGSGNLILSVTGGRKNMSADIQKASDVFGCRGMIHIADNIRKGSILQNITPALLRQPLPAEESGQLTPMVVSAKKHPHAVLFVDQPLTTAGYPLKEGINHPDLSLQEEIDRRLGMVGNLIINHHQQRIRHSPQNSFYGLQLIPPHLIHQLETEITGHDTGKFNRDLNWLRRLPKAELHCHIGGILDPADMIEVALSVEEEIKRHRTRNNHYDTWLNIVEAAVKNNDDGWLLPYIEHSKDKLRKFPQIPSPFGVAGFLSAFRDKPELLEKLIFGKFREPGQFVSVGIEQYEKLGDLQGSALLGHPATLRKTCEILVRKCRQENIRYCELRCSPANYAGSGFSTEQVVDVIASVLARQQQTVFQLLIIGSRHNRTDLLQAHVELAMNLVNSQKYGEFFAGFDIAGNEAMQSPLKLKQNLSSLLHECVKMTIHAGEGQNVENIWEAAYELNADRIGHGLTLENDQRLLKRFIDRKIAVEMCPSSNLQIVGYRDFSTTGNTPDKIYPLRKYFDQGVKVTVNTDNPGISRTNLSMEYLTASRLTPGGLSRWDILKIVRNGFKSAFLNGNRKKELLLEVEKEIAGLCLND